MPRSLYLLALGLVSSIALGQAAPTTIEELWRMVQRQQAEVDALKRSLSAAEAQIANANQKIEATEDMVVATGDYVERLEVSRGGDRRVSLGAYGELHYNSLDAEDPGNDLDEIDLHRFVIFLGHEFTDRVRFFSELEIEHSLVGEGQPGEVELEQAFLNFALNDTISARGGLFLVPVGILNETHEPPTFYGVERNDVESVILPSTWWEAGGGLNGRFANGLSWDFALHSGLAMPTTGSSAFRIRSGRQKVAQALASDPAYTVRLKYTGRPGLELAASYQYQSDPSQIAGDGLDSGSLLTAHAIYQIGDFTLRGLYGAWSLEGDAVEAAGADEQTGWFLEPSYRLSPRWGVYARYEDIEGGRNQDRFAQWETGVSYWPTPDVVLKFDYRSREHDVATELGRDFDGFDVGMGYQF